MHLTRFTDLSLRVLMYLTYRNRTALVTVNELADRFQWSRNHIVKVAHFMNAQGWIASYRGRSGGLKLAKDPSEYRIGDIVRVLEGGDHSLIDCNSPRCTMIEGCTFRVIQQEAYEAFYEKLNDHTLASITSDPTTQKVIMRMNKQDRRGSRHTGNIRHRDMRGRRGIVIIKDDENDVNDQED